jgi:hypothetical protein
MLLSWQKLTAWFMRHPAAMAKGWAMSCTVLGCWQHTETSLWGTCRKAAAALQATLLTFEDCQKA